MQKATKIPSSFPIYRRPNKNTHTYLFSFRNIQLKIQSPTEQKGLWLDSNQIFARFFSDSESKLFLPLTSPVRWDFKNTNTHQMACKTTKKPAGTIKSSDPMDHLRLKTTMPGIL